MFHLNGSIPKVITWCWVHLIYAHPTIYPSALDHRSNLMTTRTHQTSPSKHDGCWKEIGARRNQLRKTRRRQSQDHPRQDFPRWALFNHLRWTGRHLLTGWFPPSSLWEETQDNFHRRSGLIDAIAWSLLPKLQVWICGGGGRMCCMLFCGWDDEIMDHAMYDNIHATLHTNILYWPNQCHFSCSGCLVLFYK